MLTDPPLPKKDCKKKENGEVQNMPSPFFVFCI